MESCIAAVRFTVEHRKGTANANADALSRLPLEDNGPCFALKKRGKSVTGPTKSPSPEPDLADHWSGGPPRTPWIAESHRKSAVTWSEDQNKKDLYFRFVLLLFFVDLWLLTYCWDLIVNPYLINLFVKTVNLHINLIGIDLQIPNTFLNLKLTNPLRRYELSNKAISKR